MYAARSHRWNIQGVGMQHRRTSAGQQGGRSTEALAWNAVQMVVQALMGNLGCCTHTSPSLASCKCAHIAAYKYSLCIRCQYSSLACSQSHSMISM